MLSGICIGTNDLKRAGDFYDEVLKTVGMKRIVTAGNEIGYGTEEGEVTFWVLTPFDGNPATVGNGVQVMFSCQNRDQVHGFYECALALGGLDEGPPGPRDYAPGYYGAYCRDTDGNKLHVALQSA